MSVGAGATGGVPLDCSGGNGYCCAHILWPDFFSCKTVRNIRKCRVRGLEMVHVDVMALVWAAKVCTRRTPCYLAGLRIMIRGCVAAQPHNMISYAQLR